MTNDTDTAFTREILAMHGNYYAFIALDLARERAAEANNQRLAALAHEGEQQPGRVRRAIARIALAIARTADPEIARPALTTH